MKTLRSRKRWVLAAIGLLLVLSILKIVFFLTVKPKITVDYVAEYNRTARPQDYDPNDNAAPYYQKAFDAFVDITDELRKPYINWPTDFNDAERALLEKWLISNTLAFEYFREALNKSYYWLERKAEKDNYIGNITTPDLACFRELTEALRWNAKFSAVKGRSRLAFENVLDCYKAGSHKCRSGLFVIEQLLGLRIKQEAIRNALIILDKLKVENEALVFLQNALQAELNTDYVPSMQAEKYLHYDALQRTFIDNGKGTGRLAWRTGWYYDTLCGKWNNIRRRLYACLAGPTRNEIVGQIEKVLTISGQIMTKTPWQIKNENTDYFEEIENINNSNWFLQIFGISPKSVFHSYYEAKAQTEALIAVLAILRYKADTGQFPETLNELVSSGYLQAVPNDPYSSSSLVYKLTKDGFKLYSVGKDFSDDGGIIEVVNEAMQMPGFGKTGIIPRVHSPDIVFWPVEDFEKLCYEFSSKETERLKEVKAPGKMEGANQPEP